jgi:hypothetical protein
MNIIRFRVYAFKANLELELECKYTFSIIFIKQLKIPARSNSE